MSIYDHHFFSAMARGARKSAAEIVPLLLGLTGARSVVDVGCGTGEWLAAFIERGIGDVRGVDGEWVDQSRLQIPAERFSVADLSQPLRLDKEYDLVLALEVAEHLPADAADVFVDSLTRLGPVVVFSAAIPFQGGTDHLNEQWPEYWIEKFARRDFVAIDCIRPRIWDNRNVEWFYAQNMMLLVRKNYSGPLTRVLKEAAAQPMSLVHPTKYLDIAKRLDECRRMFETASDISSIVPLGECFIFIDQDQLRSSILAGAQAIPFTERDGKYWGPPPEDAAAISELLRLQALEPKFLIIAWPALWWLDFYQGFARHLRENFPSVLQNQRLIAFDLRKRHGAS